MIEFSYANTGGSGDRTALITVTMLAGTFAGSLTDFINGDFSTFVLPDENWSFRFDFGTQKYIRQWTLWTVNTSGITVRVSGSNDGSTWTRLGNIDETWSAADLQDGTKGNGLIYTPIIDNLRSYRYYKMERISGSGAFTMREVEFYIGGVSTGLPYTTTRYDGGAGDRRPIMTLSTNKGTVSGSVDLLVDGTSAGITTDESNDTYIQWDFYGLTVFDVFRFEGFYSSPNLHGTWNILGSNDDWATSDVVKGDFGTPGFGTGFDTTMDAPGFYSSYRLQNVNGTHSSNTQSQEEFEFRLAPYMNFVEDGGGSGTARVAVTA